MTSWTYSNAANPVLKFGKGQSAELTTSREFTIQMEIEIKNELKIAKKDLTLTCFVKTGY